MSISHTAFANPLRALHLVNPHAWILLFRASPVPRFWERKELQTRNVGRWISHKTYIVFFESVSFPQHFLCSRLIGSWRRLPTRSAAVISNRGVALALSRNVWKVWIWSNCITLRNCAPFTSEALHHIFTSNRYRAWVVHVLGVTRLRPCCLMMPQPEKVINDEIF